MRIGPVNAIIELLKTCWVSTKTNISATYTWPLQRVTDPFDNVDVLPKIAGMLYCITYWCTHHSILKTAEFMSVYTFLYQPVRKTDAEWFTLIFTGLHVWAVHLDRLMSCVCLIFAGSHFSCVTCYSECKYWSMNNNDDNNKHVYKSTNPLPL